MKEPLIILTDSWRTASTRSFRNVHLQFLWWKEEHNATTNVITRVNNIITRVNVPCKKKALKIYGYLAKLKLIVSKNGGLKLKSPPPSFPRQLSSAAIHCRKLTPWWPGRGTNICFWLQDVHAAWVHFSHIWHMKSKLQYPTQFHFLFELSLQGDSLTMIHSHKHVQSKRVTHKSTELGKPKRKVKSCQNCKRPSGNSPN